MKTIFPLFIILFLLPSTVIYAADLEKLKDLFAENYQTQYRPRFCGQNIEVLVKEAKERGIDLTGAYVLKIVGAGFFETSGMYTRNHPNQREMLGYFHYVLVADDEVFDFDLHRPLILNLQDYFRLQFTPPYQPFYVFGVEYNPKAELKWWTVTRFEWENFISGRLQATWSKKMGELFDLDELMKRQRII